MTLNHCIQATSFHTVCLAVSLSLVPLSGCQVTSEKIKTWKTTVKGPAKLQVAVGDSDLATPLRIEAAAALCDIGETQRLLAALNKMDSAVRATICVPLADILLTSMKGTSAQATSRKQLAAKDTLFSIRAWLGAKQATVDDAIVNWLVADFTGRDEGDHGSRKIIKAIGQRAAQVIAAQITAEPKHVNLMAGFVRTSGRPEDIASSAKQVIAMATQEKPLQSATAEALGLLATDATRAFLVARAKDAAADLEQRALAIRALTKDPNAAVSKTMIAFAADAKVPKKLRAAAFQVLDKLASPVATEGLAKIIATDGDETVRYRAVEALCSCCGANGVLKLLSSLPARYTFKKADVVDFIEKDIRDVGKTAIPALRKALKMSNPVSRVVAVRLLASMKDTESLSAMNALTGDRAKLKGWGKSTVAQEAKAAIAAMSGGK